MDSYGTDTNANTSIDTRKQKIVPLIFLIFTLSFHLTLSVGITGCDSLGKKTLPETNPIAKREQYEKDEELLKKWHEDLKEKKFLGVSNEIHEFFKTHPHSQHWFGISFYQGKAKEGLEDWTGAIGVYKQIVDRSMEPQMEYIALAYYRMAYCYEVLLENEKALAALSDATKLGAYLPLEITQAELPARMASVYARLGQINLADQFAQKAEKGVAHVRSVKKESDLEWLSLTLLRMGALSLTHLDKENFRQYLMTLNRNQRYLVQAIELNHPLWGPEAQKNLVSTYTNLWSFIEHYQIQATADWEADFVVEAQTKTEFLSLYLEVIENLKNYEAPDESPVYKKTESLYKQIQILETKAVTLLQQETRKRPWQKPFGGLNLIPPGHLMGRETSSTLQLESLERPAYIPNKLPQKRTK